MASKTLPKNATNEFINWAKLMILFTFVYSALMFSYKYNLRSAFGTIISIALLFIVALLVDPSERARKWFKIELANNIRRQE
jgi:cell division protein FtsW (lipid II flippase)